MENSKEFESSVNRFENMLKTNEIFFFDVQEFENIIHYYIDSGGINLAKKALKLANDQHPFNIELILLKSELLIFEGNFDKALLILDSCEKMDPNNHEIFIQKATILSKKNKHRLAINYLEKSLDFSEDPYEIWTLLGMEHMKLNDYTKAKKYFNFCLKIDINDYQSLYNVLYCYDELKEFNNSIALLNSILEKKPYNEIAWFELGKQYLKLKKNKEALSAFDFAIISEEKFVGAYIEKGKVLEKMGKLPEAIEHFEISLQFEDPSSFIFSKIGQCHQKLKNHQIAAKFYKKSIALDPSNIDAWNKIIDFYIEINRYKKAISYLESFLKIDYDNIESWEKIGSLYLKINFYSLAKDALEKAIKLGSYNKETWTNYIDSLLFLKRWEAAFELAEEAKKHFPLDNSIDYRIAGCFLKMGKYFKAKNYFKNFTKKNSKAPNSLKKLFPEFSQVEKKK